MTSVFDVTGEAVAMGIEKQTLRSDSLRVEVLPELGAKISSVRVLPDEQELLQQPLKACAARTRTMAFEDGDASGIDECIPTVSGCAIPTEHGEFALPDHGDFWRIPFACRREGEELALEAEGFSLPLRFEKRIGLKDNVLRLGYRLENIGTGEVPFLWSAHPGFAVDAGDRIVLPDSVGEITVWHSGGSRLGEPGRVHSWPRTTDSSGRSVDLSVVGGVEEGVGDKIFARSPTEGWVALDRRKIGCRVEMRFDPAQAPALGLWLAYGGWPAGRTKRQHCVALEPCTAPADSLATAIERGWARTLAAGGSWNWSVEIRVIPA
jgi:galactose mutarotase-like enzyme